MTVHDAAAPVFMFLSHRQSIFTKNFFEKFTAVFCQEFGNNILKNYYELQILM